MEIQWSLVLFAAFVALGSGVFIASAVFSEWMGLAKQTRKPAMILSAAAVIIGAIASMTHLGHLDRIFGVLSNPSSGIFVEGLSSALLVLIIVIYFIAMQRDASAGVLKGIASVGVIPAVAVNVALGMSYAMVARPAWDIAALPMLSLTTALFMGCITIFALQELTSKKEVEEGGDAANVAKSSAVLKKATIAMAVVQAIVVVAYVALVGAAPYQEASRSAARMFTGDLAFLFWGGVIACGIVVPIAMALVAKVGPQSDSSAGAATSSTSNEAVVPQAGANTSAVLLVVALACVFVAIIAFRMIMFSLGSSIIAFGF